MWLFVKTTTGMNLDKIPISYNRTNKYLQPKCVVVPDPYSWQRLDIIV